jgi:hypothetical protein
MKEDWSADTVRIVYITINIWQPLTCYHGHIFGVENSCETELEVVVKKKKVEVTELLARPINYYFLSN